MKQLNGNDQSEFLLTFSDLLKIIKKNKYAILNIALMCALIAVCYGLLKPVEYRVEATFKEKGKSQSGLNQSLSALLLNSETNESDALTMMRSRMLIEKLVASLGLQASIIKKEFSIPIPFKRIKDNLLSEYAHLKNLTSPLIKAPEEHVRAEKITYAGEVPLELALIFFSKENFRVESNGQIMGEGVLGQPVITDQFAFTLQKVSPNVIPGKQYRLILQPLGKTAQRIAKNFVIEADRFDNSLLKIAYRHTDKYHAVAHTNALMDLYKEHSHQEHQKVCNLQIAYLQQKQADMGKQLEDLMHAHASRLSSDLSNSGFADYTAAMNYLTSNQHHYHQKLQALELEIHWLEQAQRGGRDEFDKFTAIQSPDLINQLTKEIRQLRHEAYSLELALGKFQPAVKSNITETLTKSFLGIDLHTAKELYLAYSKELNALEAQEAQFNFIISQINLPDFEISSLSGVLIDPISVEMISKASPLILALKDQDNRTNKEQERLHSGLAVHKNFFITHLGQTNQLVQLRQQLMKEKIELLQHAHLILINEQISILENQMSDYIAQRLIALKHEKELYDQNLIELRAEMAGLPQKWVAEQMIQQQMEINQNMIEQISKLVESKNLALNLEKTQSTSVDLPMAPLHPQSPRLFLLALIGALAGALGSTSVILIKSIGKGVIASAENLRLAGQHVSGELSLNSGRGLSPALLLDSDLDTLRRAIACITHSESFFKDFDKNTILLLGHTGSSHVEMLAQLMFKMGFKILILDLSFATEDSKNLEGGLLQYLKGDIGKPVIEHTTNYDIIHCGGITRFANELLASEKFMKFLNNIQRDYDWVVAFNSSSPLSIEAQTLLTQFSKAIICVDGESLQELRDGIFHYTQNIPTTFVLLN